MICERRTNFTAVKKNEQTRTKHEQNYGIEFHEIRANLESFILEIQNNLGTKQKNRMYLASFATFVTVKLVFLDHEVSSLPSLEGIVTPLVQITF